MENIVSYRKEGSVLVLTINRRDLNNIINSYVVSQFAEIQQRIIGDKDIRVIIVTGAGEESFSLGTDWEEFRTFKKEPKLIGQFSIASTVSQFDRPTIAAINGNAFGQGLELALACDLRICADHARLAMDQIIHGEMPWDGGTQRFSRLVGKGKAMEMILTGGSVDGQEAYRIGLVNQVVPREKLAAAAMDMAQEIASKAPIALKYAKEAVYKGMDVTLDQGLRLEADLYFLLQSTRDRGEGIRAFQEKRTPGFEGK